MNRKTVSGLMLMLLFVSMLMFILHPTYAASTTTPAHETHVEGEPRHGEQGLTSHTPEWNKTYGGTASDGVLSMVETGDGGYALAGETESFVVDGPDFWLIKTDASGSVEWNQTYGGPSSDCAWSMVETGDGGYALAGYTYSFGAGGSDFWLVKTNQTGEMEWNQTYGGTDYDYAYSVVQTIDGGYAVAGKKWSFGGGKYDFWLVKTDAYGNMEWNQTYGGTDYDWAYSVVQTIDGGYAVAGFTGSFGAGGDDFWLVKTDAYGNMEWNQTYGGASGDRAYSIVETGDGGYAVAGYTWSFGPGYDDFWLVKTDAAGTMVWNQAYGGTYSDIAYSVVETGDGGYALAGHTFSLVSGYDFWLVKTDTDGSMEWNQTCGGPEWDMAYSVVETGDGGYAIAGWTESFGAGSRDSWLVKIAGQELEETAVFFNVDPNPASVGETITFRGILVDEFSQPLSNETVRLYGRRLAGSWIFITSLTANTYGIFVWHAEIPIADVFIFAVYYPGSESYESSYNFAVLMVQ